MTCHFLHVWIENRIVATRRVAFFSFGILYFVLTFDLLSFSQTDSAIRHILAVRVGLLVQIGCTLYWTNIELEYSLEELKKRKKTKKKEKYSRGQSGSQQIESGQDELCLSCYLLGSLLQVLSASCHYLMLMPPVDFRWPVSGCLSVLSFILSRHHKATPFFWIMSCSHSTCSCSVLVLSFFYRVRAIQFKPLSPCLSHVQLLTTTTHYLRGWPLAPTRTQQTPRLRSFKRTKTD